MGALAPCYGFTPYMYKLCQKACCAITKAMEAATCPQLSSRLHIHQFSTPNSTIAWAPWPFCTCFVHLSRASPPWTLGHGPSRLGARGEESKDQMGTSAAGGSVLPHQRLRQPDSVLRARFCSRMCAGFRRTPVRLDPPLPNYYLLGGGRGVSLEGRPPPQARCR